MQRHFEQMNRTAKEVFFKDCAAQLGLKDVSANNFAEKIICLLFFLLDIPTNNQRNIRNNQLPLLELSNDYIDKFGACLLRDANNICMNKDCNNLLTYIDKNRTINNYQVLDLKMKTKTKAGRYENLIAVCPLCFERLQGHLSSEQTEYFTKLKQSHISQNEMQNLLLETNIDQSISKLLTQISNIGLHIENIEIKNPVKPSEKFDSSLDYGNKIQIEALVKMTYLFVRNIIKQLDENGEIKYELLQASVKLKYLQLKDRSTSQEEIFIQLVDYFKNISNQSDSVCRIVVSYFIQNCDVFEIPKGD
jgi:HNH endonuclease domain protein